MPSRLHTKVFSPKDFSVVASDWDGTEAYWTRAGDHVHTTVVGVDSLETAVIRYINTDVGSTFGRVRVEFPDSDEWLSGDMSVNSNYPSVTKREIHTFDKRSNFPLIVRVDFYNGAALLKQVYIFRETSDSAVYKYGFRVRHLVAPSSFSFDYEVGDDSLFPTMGLILEGKNAASVNTPADVVGNTYFFSMPVAYLPAGEAFTGSASDTASRVVSLIAIFLALFAIIYAVLFPVVYRPNPSKE